MKPRSAAVVAVGELARSPRMLNHARELAAAGFRVFLIGYREQAVDAGGVTVCPLRRARRRSASAAWSLAGAGLRMGWAFLNVTALLLRLRPEVILLQNPPSFPTLLAGWIAASLLRARWIIDWHNYGHSMLGLRLGGAHALTRLSARYEGWAARRASGHFCVSQAMRADLERRFGVCARVLYDRPVDCAPAPQPAAGRLLAVSPCGWTADEDVDLLFDALGLLEPCGFEFHLTGDGPRRQQMQSRIRALRDRGFKIEADFLSEPDYRALLRRASLGLSLHRSSSRLDLPMKIVDLFAAGVPVCALDYGPVLREQVSPGETGLLFQTAAELAELLGRLQREPALLAQMRRCVRARWTVNWHREWQSVAAPAVGAAHAA